MKSQNSSLKSVAVFLSLTFGLSAIFYFFIIYSGKLSGAYNMYAAGIMWCPGIAALITLKIQKRNLNILGWGWNKTKYQIWSFFIPFIYSFIAYSIIWLIGWGEFYNKDSVQNISDSFGLGALPDGLYIALYVILVGIYGMVTSTAYALGEEIGWRGFLVPELYKNFGFTKTAFITGLIWAVWHIPLLLFADYNSGTPLWYALGCFTILVIGGSFIFAWFRIKSDSLWTATLLHASHNLFIQSIFTPLTQDTGNTEYFSDEFGIVVPLVMLVFAIYFWRRRKELVFPKTSMDMN